MLEIVICEDNERYLNSFSSIIEKALRSNNINGRLVCKANNPYAVEEYIKHNSANVFFLDIDLKAADNGYTLARKIREINKKAYIVFISGHLEFLLQAFKVKTFDFLPKPVSADILEQCLLNIYEDYVSTACAQDREEYVEVKSGSSLYRIKARDIIYIEKLNSKTILHMANSMISCYESLETLESQLDGDTFIRCHKSFIANRSYVSEIRFNSNEIIFETGQVCYLGRKYKKGMMPNVQLQYSS